jgi:hypothetical protein
MLGFFTSHPYTFLTQATGDTGQGRAECQGRHIHRIVEIRLGTALHHKSQLGQKRRQHMEFRVAVALTV